MKEYSGTMGKSCPFCGGAGKMYSQPVSFNGDRVYQVKCEECGASAAARTSYDNAFQSWNRR